MWDKRCGEGGGHDKNNCKHLERFHWCRLNDILGQTVPRTWGGDHYDRTHGFHLLVLRRTSVISTVLANISWRARTERDCSRMKVQMAKSGGTFCNHTDSTEVSEGVRLHTALYKQEKTWSRRLTWALDVVSRKQRRFPNPSQDRHNLICSFRMEAVHCRTTWSSCIQKSQHQSLDFLLRTRTFNLVYAVLANCTTKLVHPCGFVA